MMLYVVLSSFCCCYKFNFFKKLLSAVWKRGGQQLALPYHALSLLPFCMQNVAVFPAFLLFIGSPISNSVLLSVQAASGSDVSQD